MNKLVVGIGETLWDILPEGKKIGGAPANFAFHIAQSGLDSIIISAVGHDMPGKELTDTLDCIGLRHQIAEVPYPTGSVQVDVDDSGKPLYRIMENVAWDNIPYTEELRDIARQTRAVCFGSLAQRSVASRETIDSFLKDIPRSGEELIVFDINLRQKFYTKEIILDSIKKCNVLKINDEELAVLSDLFGYPGLDIKGKCRHILSKHDLRMLVLTCGINGSYVFTPGNVSFMSAPEVKVVDTVGAGDAFTASLVAALLKGQSITDAHRQAAAVSAYVCTRHGAMPALPPEYA